MAQRWSSYISNIETFHNKYIEVFLWISSNTSCQTLYSGTYSESSCHPEWIVGTDQLIVVFNSMASCWMCSTTADPFFSDQKNELKILLELLASHTDKCHCRTSWYQNLPTSGVGANGGSPDSGALGEMTTLHISHKHRSVSVNGAP